MDTSPIIQNFVGTANLNVKLVNLQQINGVYRKGMNMKVIRMKYPKSTILLFKTGKIVINGVKKEIDLEIAAINFATIIQGYGYQPNITDIKIRNITASCNLHFLVDMTKLYSKLSHCRFEPEIFPGLIYNLQNPKITFIIFQSGKVIITGAKVTKHIHRGFNFLFPTIQDCIKGVTT
jgi:transcription initiation factor TFIID TATA-box-binding protein